MLLSPLWKRLVFLSPCRPNANANKGKERATDDVVEDIEVKETHSMDEKFK